MHNLSKPIFYDINQCWFNSCLTKDRQRGGSLSFKRSSHMYSYPTIGQGFALLSDMLYCIVPTIAILEVESHPSKQT